MSAASLERPTGIGSTGIGPVEIRTVGPTRTRQLRPGRGGGRGTRPVSRSVSGVRGPAIGRTLRVDARGCRPEFAASLAPSRTGSIVAESAAAGWRLTNRGIAAILITGAVLAAAALTVITATAITVTSEGYHPHGSALSHR